MIGKINKGFSTTENVSPNELSDPAIQKDTLPQVSHETENSQKNCRAMENMATDRKALGSVEATVRRLDIENNFHSGESQMGKVVAKNNTEESESIQQAVDEATTKRAFFQEIEWEY